MKAVILILLLAIPTLTNAQARPASCEVRPSWIIKGGPGSANLEPIGIFQLDGREGSTVRSFKLLDTALVITVAVDFEFEYSRPKPRPHRISDCRS
jgi:hypothetical protein